MVFISYNMALLGGQRLKPKQVISRGLTLFNQWTIACQAYLLWYFPGNNTRVGCYFLIQGIFMT